MFKRGKNKCVHIIWYNFKRGAINNRNTSARSALAILIDHVIARWSKNMFGDIVTIFKPRFSNENYFVQKFKIRSR